MGEAGCDLLRVGLLNLFRQLGERLWLVGVSDVRHRSHHCSVKRGWNLESDGIA